MRGAAVSSPFYFEPTVRVSAQAFSADTRLLILKESQQHKLPKKLSNLNPAAINFKN